MYIKNVFKSAQPKKKKTDTQDKREKKSCYATEETTLQARQRVYICIHIFHHLIYIQLQ